MKGRTKKPGVEPNRDGIADGVACLRSEGKTTIICGTDLETGPSTDLRIAESVFSDHVTRDFIDVWLAPRLVELFLESYNTEKAKPLNGDL